MPLLRGIVPKPGEVFVCDFSGYVEPEIIKTRRVVVVSPQHSGARLALVVPVSTVKPRVILPIHVQLEGERTYGCFNGLPEVWVKADLMSHVRYDRLDRVRIRQQFIPTVSLTARDFRAVRQAVLHALGLGRLADQV
ncbi:MAG: type II toxin-antitoxin system PemK/MazF family toxin [Candidatus Cybelea sp.]